MLLPWVSRRRQSLRFRLLSRVLPLLFLSSPFSLRRSLSTSASLAPPLSTFFEWIIDLGPPGYRPFFTCKGSQMEVLSPG